MRKIPPLWPPEHTGANDLGSQKSPFPAQIRRRGGFFLVSRRQFRQDRGAATAAAGSRNA